MVNSALGNLEQEFHVIHDGRIDILGLPWIQAIGLNIMYPSKSLTSELSRAIVAFNDSVESASLCTFSVQQESVLQQAAEVFTLEQIQASIDPSLREEERNLLVEILIKYPSIWQQSGVGKCNLLKCEIRLKPGTEPIRQASRRYSAEQSAEIVRQVTDLLQAGAIRPSKSPWCSQNVMIPKKGGEWRMCTDYRDVNKVTVKDSFPLPLIQDLIDRLDGAKYFIAMDMKAGFHQIRMDSASSEITAFATPNGLFEYTVMPFGLVNAPAIFQRMAQMVFGEDYGNICLVYIDDIIIFAKTFEELVARFEKCCEHMQRSNIYINVRKCRFGFRQIKYLGHIISEGRCMPDPESLSKVDALVTPRDVQSLRRFLGCMGFFRMFIPNYAEVTRPLHLLLRKDKSFDWSQDCDIAHKSLKAALKRSPIYLELPRSNWEFVLDTDASTLVIAAVLMQRDPENPKKLHVIQYASHSLTDAESKWAIQELEAYAIVWAIIKFEHYLRDRPFTVRTDHQSLSWLWSSVKRRLSRWAMFLQDFNFSIIYQPGTQQSHVDIFTRDVAVHPLDEVIDDRIGHRLQVNNAAVSKRRIPLLPLPSNLDMSAVSPFPSVAEFISESATDPQVPFLSLTRSEEGLFSKEAKVYVPASLRSRILYVYHHSHVGAHIGVNALVRRVRERFYWPYLPQDAQQFVDQCVVCRRRRNYPKPQATGNLLSRDVLSLIAIDMVGPVDHNQESFRILTVICHASRYAAAIVMPAKCTGEAVWSALMTHWFSVWSFPTALLSDNGTSFCNKFIDDCCQEFGIRHYRSSAYYPQGNGVIESFHQFLKKSLSTTLATHPALSLQDAVNFILIAYRSTPHSSTGDSPYRILTGLDFVLPNLQEWTQETFSSRSLGDRLTLLLQLRHDALQVSLSKVLDRQSHSKTQPLIEVGDIIIAHLSPYDARKMSQFLGPLKLAPQWSEPMRVTRLGKDGHTLQAKSIWHDKLTRQFNLNQVQALPKDCDPVLLPLLIEDIKKDRSLHRSSENTVRRSASKPDLPSHQGELEYRMLQGLMTSPGPRRKSVSVDQDIEASSKDGIASAAPSPIVGTEPSDSGLEQVYAGGLSKKIRILLKTQRECLLLNYYCFV